ncbi:hypothetical protein [Neolewinella sp.]|uniref:hypothetical protein n=1 Tax=Neolewinella sp. TaxID=2993543 RepID=UPI003B51A3E8
MDILDQPLSPVTEEHVLVIALAWWEGRRLWFNGAVLLSGIAGIVLPPFNLFSDNRFILLEIAVWAILVNLAYCAGYMLEALAYQYQLNWLRLGKLRWVLFKIGTGLVSFATFSFANLWYIRGY